MNKILDAILEGNTLNSMDLRREEFVYLYSTTPSTIKFLENSIEETIHTKKIESLMIPSDFNILTIALKTS